MQIRVEALTFETIIGILAHEREAPQRVVVDITMDYRYDGDRFVDYAEVCDAVIGHMQESRFRLVEEALESTTRMLMRRFATVEAVTMTLYKPDIVPQARVGVRFSLQRKAMRSQTDGR